MDLEMWACPVKLRPASLSRTAPTTGSVSPGQLAPGAGMAVSSTGYKLNQKKFKKPC